MKYAIIIPEGCADAPLADLDGCTPLVVAHTPALDGLRPVSRLGTATFTPAGLPCTDDVTLMSLLGYDPTEHSPGSAPLEALGRGSPLKAGAWGLRLSMVTVRDGRLIDHTAGGIGSAETAALLEDLASVLHDELGDAAAGLRLVPTSRHRGLLIDDAERSFDGLVTHSPSLLLDRPIRRRMPDGEGRDLMRGIVEVSGECFQDHPVNEARIETGLEPATHVWPWGQGCGFSPTEALPAFADRFDGLNGLMICSRDLPAGLARLIGWDVQRIDDDADYEAKGEAAIDGLDGRDVVCVHLARPDAAAHGGDYEAKIDSLIEIDRQVIAPLADWLTSTSESRMLVAPSHQTGTSTRRHEPDPAPFMMAGKDVEARLREPYTEANAQSADLHIEAGDELMEYFLFGSGIRRWRT